MKSGADFSGGGREGAKGAKVLLVGFVLVATSLSAADLRATVPLAEGEWGNVTLSGQVRNQAGVQRFTYDTLGLLPTNSGVDSAVIRFEWRADVGERVSIELHDVFFFRVTSTEETLAGGGLGIGVSAIPGRTVDLSSELINEGGLLFTHDVDRLALRLYLDAADITLGRQALTWGRSSLFPVADLWGAFSPFESNTSEKPGSDAIRLITSPWERVELDFVVADRGELEDLSGGVRANLFLDRADAFVGMGKFWNELILLGGVSADVDSFSITVEGALPLDLDDGSVELPRATAGFMWFTTDLVLGFEYHFNGEGRSSNDEYLEEYGSEEVARGETYLVGQHYAGALLSYLIDPLVSLNLSVIGNLADPSVIIAPSARYDIAQSVDITAGTYNAIGGEPEFALPPILNSEFGTYGDFYYVMMVGYY